MRRIVLWVAAILITFTIGVGADRLWWHFLAAPPTVEAAPVDVAVPEREIVYVQAPAPPTPPPAPPKPNFILDYDGHYLEAGFYPMGPVPKEFADFESLSIWLNPGPNEEYQGEIYVRTHRAEYNGSLTMFALVTNRRVFFATSKLEHKDFEYRFDGEFLRKDWDAVSGKKIAVLRGTLTKTKNGRTVAQHEFTFRMEHEGC